MSRCSPRFEDQDSCAVKSLVVPKRKPQSPRRAMSKMVNLLLVTFWAAKISVRLREPMQGLYSWTLSTIPGLVSAAFQVDAIAPCLPWLAACRFSMKILLRYNFWMSSCQAVVNFPGMLSGKVILPTSRSLRSSETRRDLQY